MAATNGAPPTIPNYMLDPDAVLKEEGVVWRTLDGKAPDYSKTREMWAESKARNHEAGSLPNLVENLVKNWEIEAGWKTRPDQWRTIDQSNFTQRTNGGKPLPVERIIEVGSYNTFVPANSFYSPERTPFHASHEIFKKMMPSFAWEVLDVYSGPPVVAIKWRHWGVMKGDYAGLNDKGEQVTFKAHSGPIDIQGTTVAMLNDRYEVRSLEHFFDVLDFFKQMAPSLEDAQTDSLMHDAIKIHGSASDNNVTPEVLTNASGTQTELEPPTTTVPNGRAADEPAQPIAGGCPFLAGSQNDSTTS